MDACWFKEQITDELDGACLYMKKAIEIKPMKAEWSKKLSVMAEAEMDHATELYKMFATYYEIMSGTYSEMPEYIENINKDINDLYTKKYPRIKVMFEMYGKM